MEIPPGGHAVAAAMVQQSACGAQLREPGSATGRNNSVVNAWAGRAQSYRDTLVNGRTVLVDPRTRRVVEIVE
jgi:hypothetical protein